MKSLVLEDNPLHKRLSTKMNIVQMNYYDSSKFYSNFTNEEKVQMYSVFGGMPYYNKFVDDTKSVKDNILNLVCSNDARFSSEVESSLERELSKITNANEVFLAIAKGYSKFTDILNHSSVTSSPTLVDVLKRLEEMDVIYKECPINDETEKKSIYSIGDRLTLFYYKYIFPKKSYFSTMPAEDFFNEFIKEDFESEYVPKEYEKIAKQYLLKENLAGRIKPVLYKIGKYYYDDAKNKRNGEFDVVTLSKDGYDFYEVKFTNKPIDNNVINEEKRQLENLDIKCNKMGFFAKNGFVVKDSKKYILINLNQIFE